MTTLVLGGCGFIGSHLVDGLLSAGHSVRVFDRSYERFRQPLQNVDYRIADFADAASLAAALDGVKLVYHLISTTVPSTSNENPEADVRENLLRALQMVHLLKKGTRVVFLSSGGTVYGIPETLPVPETHPIAPICSHGVVKSAIENYLRMFNFLDRIPYCVLRVSNPYGLRQGKVGLQGVVSTFIERTKNEQVLEVWGDGSVMRDFIHIDDLVNLCIRAGQSDVDGMFNAGCGEGYTINEVISLIEKAAGRKIDVRYFENRAFDVPKIYLDISKARREFGWLPEIDLAEGIERLWTSYGNEPQEPQP
jgi:UDP-glucose 4-epimerase